MRPKGAPGTGSRSEPPAPLIFEDQSIAPGSRKIVELRVARLPSGAWVNMAVIIVHGSQPGPTLWMSGAIHGDELNGVPIIQELLRAIEADSLRGTIMAAPCVNGFGVTTGSRYLPDRRDLNRSFPGAIQGSLASRLAHLFFDRVAIHGTLGLDFHSGSGGRCNLPQIRCDLDHDAAARYAHAFSPPALIHTRERKGTLRAAAGQRSIPVLVYEAGEASRLDRTAVDTGVSGTLRVMRALDMIDSAPEPPPVMPLIARKTSWVRATTSGFCLENVELGQMVSAGEQVATISDSVGKRRTSVRARTSGMVIGVLRTAVVHRGDALVHIAEPHR